MTALQLPGPLRRLFQASYVLADGSRLASRGLLPPVAIINRSSCVFEPVELKGPIRDVVRAVRLETARKSRFADPYILVIRPVPQSAFLQVWSWERSLTGSLPFQPFRRILPETLARSLPEADDAGTQVRLMRCLNGFEGEVWKGGVLQASRWWPGQPDDAEWHTFIRAGRGDVLGPVPAARAPPWRDWINPVNPVLEDYRRWLTPMRVLIGAFILLGLMVSFEAGRFVRLAAEHRLVQAEVSQDRDSLLQAQQARRRALTVMDRVEALAALPASDQSLRIMADLAALTAGQDVELEQFRLVGTSVEVRISGALALSPAEFVLAFQERSGLSDVSVDLSDQGEWLVRARIGQASQQSLSDPGP